MNSGIFLFGIGWLALCMSVPYPTNRNLALVLMTTGLFVLSGHMWVSVWRAKRKADNVKPQK